MKSYAVIVIGAGAGGLVVAIGCARAGKKILLIEKGHWGGDCTNFGCIPSKTLIGQAALHREGAQALAHVREVVRQVRFHEEPEALQKLGVETLTGTASFIDPHVIEVRDREGFLEQIEGKRIVLATGSFPRTPSIPGLGKTPYLTNETVFDLEHLPKNLIVLGGGPIGCELAQAFQRLGSSVKLVHRHSHLLNREPQRVQEVIAETFGKEGIELYLGFDPEQVTYDSGSFKLRLKNVEQEVIGDQLLVAVGRQPSLADLSLEKAHIEFSPKGIKVDDYGRTSQKHIFAIGDAVGPPFFTHLAENRARTVLTNLLLSPFWRKKISKQSIPRVTYTDPEVASLGMSEEEAIERYGKSKIATYLIPMTESDRAITQDRTEGFVKVVTKRWSSKILGATIVAPRAGEMIMEIALAMSAKIPLRKLSGLIHPYPTYSLAIRKAADHWLTETILPFLRGIWKR